MSGWGLPAIGSTSWRSAAFLLAVLLGSSMAALAQSSMHRAVRDVPAQPAVVGQQAARSYRFVYVAIGASDSYGVGTADPATESWPAVLVRHLPAGTHFVNLGVPGILLRRALEVELPVALDAHPTLVTVWLAVNDLAGGVPLSRYRHDLGVMLGTLHRRTRARVLIANVPDLTVIPSFAGAAGLVATIAAWNAAIAAEARAHGAILVDLYAHRHELVLHPEWVGPDGLHPTAEGYRQLAALFWRAYVAAGPPRA